LGERSYYFEREGRRRRRNRELRVLNLFKFADGISIENFINIVDGRNLY